MKTDTIGGIEYEIGKLPTMKQLQVGRRLAPLIAAAAPGIVELSLHEQSGEDAGNAEATPKPKDERAEIDLMKLVLTSAAVPTAEMLAKMPDQDFEYVVNECLAVCQRRQAKGWARVYTNGVLMFADIEGGTVIALVRAVIEESLGSFFPTRQPESPAPNQ